MQEIKRQLWRHILKGWDRLRFMSNSKLNKNYIDFQGNWPCKEREYFLKDMRIIPNFVNDEEEYELFNEAEPYMKRLRYEIDHWDDAIHGYRETERKHWYPHNRKIINRIQRIAFICDLMPHVHILDLAQEGIIKPHVDSTRFCGDKIAGLSLLSDCVMRLIRIDPIKYKQNPQGDTTQEYYRNLLQTSTHQDFYANILLPRRSLYVMSDTARYNFTHEILGTEHSIFMGQYVTKSRRISIICRNKPIT